MGCFCLGFHVRVKQEEVEALKAQKQALLLDGPTQLQPMDARQELLDAARAQGEAVCMCVCGSV